MGNSRDSKSSRAGHLTLIEPNSDTAYTIRSTRKKKAPVETGAFY